MLAHRFWILSLRLRMLAVLLVATMLCPAGLRAETVSVAAAASLGQVLRQLGDAYIQVGGDRLRVSYAASGVLARQITHGAPFEVFLSANERYVEYLGERGMTDGKGMVYALGELALFIPAGSALEPLATDEPGGLELLRLALQREVLKRLVIANPDHAPYGVAAREALRHAGLWQQLSGKLVFGENAAQAARFSASGAADAGLIPLVISRQRQFAGRGQVLPIENNSYAPLRQRVVLISGASEAARHFVAFLGSPVAERILLDSGFRLPSGEVQ